MANSITIKSQKGGWSFTKKYKGIEQSTILTRRLSTIIEEIENLED